MEPMSKLCDTCMEISCICTPDERRVAAADKGGTRTLHRSLRSVWKPESMTGMLPLYLERELLRRGQRYLRWVNFDESSLVAVDGVVLFRSGEGGAVVIDAELLEEELVRVRRQAARQRRAIERRRER